MHTHSFNEPEWIKLIFLLADTQQWVNDLYQSTFDNIPVEKKEKLQRKTYQLGVTALAHIIERHYYKIPRHPGTGKFNIPLPVILQYIREAGSITPLPIPGSLNLQRICNCTEPVGFDKNGEPAYCITLISNAAGQIITAFPGVLSGNLATVGGQMSLS